MQKLQQHVYTVLEERSGGIFGKFVNAALIFLIASNVFIIILESEKAISQAFSHELIVFEYITLTVFLTEYLLRIWVAPNNPKAIGETPLKRRLHYLISPMAIIDLLAILPSILGFFMDGNLLALRIIRLLRGLKVTRYSQSMSLLIDVLKRESGSMLSTFFILGIVIMLAATGIYFVEGEEQPDNFGSIPKALWWATVTLTTIGYGDVVPITTLGRIFGGLIAITGITMAALPAGILASGFSTELNRRRDAYRYQVIEFLDKGSKISEIKRLYNTRKELGISKGDSLLIMRELKQEIHISSEAICPHCHETFHVFHPPGSVTIKKKKDG